VSGHDYAAEHLTVLEVDEAVRRRPGMYFGVAREDPRFATAVLRAVLLHALHPSAALAPDHTPRVYAEITADLAFTVTDDQADLGRGYFGSLLTPHRWASAAAAAVSVRTLVEVWKDGRGRRQELAGLRPVGSPADYAAPAGAGTRMSFELAPAAPIAADLAALDVHGDPECASRPGSGFVRIRDSRQSGGEDWISTS
jgi:hypothetical protein